VQFYNLPWQKHSLGFILPRNHRKLMIADRKVAHMGGVCIHKSMADWRDTNARLEGPIAAEFVNAFETLWRETKGKKPRRGFAPFQADPHTAIYTNDPAIRRQHFTQLLFKKLNEAQESVCLTTPYYIVHRGFQKQLIRLMKRGVKVHILYADRSHNLLRSIAYTYFGELLRHGAQISLYRDVMLHTKTAIIDGNWAAVGSVNLDYLSLFRNHELSLVTTDANALHMLKTHFRQDTASSHLLTLEEWKRRALWKKVFGAVLWPFRKVL
jgi:cardiolipin synthase A/B